MADHRNKDVGASIWPDIVPGRRCGNGIGCGKAVGGDLADLKRWRCRCPSDGPGRRLRSRPQGTWIPALPAAFWTRAIHAPQQVRADARDWGSELLQAGVNVDLAPVLDTVPSPEICALNKPLGRSRRKNGFTPAAVSSRERDGGRTGGRRGGAGG